MSNSVLKTLLVARQIANYAMGEGALVEDNLPRGTCEHLGAVLADSVLQAGLNYTTVVRPRVLNILHAYPDFDTITSLVSLIQKGQTASLLNWQHHEKVNRFEELVIFLHQSGIQDTNDLRQSLVSDNFCMAMQSIHGIGPKTVDYMACLVGIDSIAVDRHVRAFAKAAGITNDDYHFLRESFCCAADLLSLPRREFDAWIWRRASAAVEVQISLAI